MPDAIEDIPRESPIFRASYAYLRTIVEGDSVPAAKDANAIAALNRQVAQTLVASVATHQRMSLIEQARTAIHHEYANERFNADELAELLNSSRSTVHRAFQAEGTTATREISRRRTAAARELQARNPSITLQELAQSCGFGSVSTLRQALLTA